MPQLAILAIFVIIFIGFAVFTFRVVTWRLGPSPYMELDRDTLGTLCLSLLARQDDWGYMKPYHYRRGDVTVIYSEASSGTRHKAVSVNGVWLDRKSAHRVYVCLCALEQHRQNRLETEAKRQILASATPIVHKYDPLD